MVRCKQLYKCYLWPVLIKKANEKKAPSQTLIKRSRRTQVPRLFLRKDQKKKQRKSYFDLKFASRNKKKRKNKEKRKKNFFCSKPNFCIFLFVRFCKTKNKGEKTSLFPKDYGREIFSFFNFRPKSQ